MNNDQSIRHFEDTYHQQNERYSAQPMLNNWSERLKELTNERIVKHKTLTR